MHCCLHFWGDDRWDPCLDFGTQNTSLHEVFKGCQVNCVSTGRNSLGSLFLLGMVMWLQCPVQHLTGGGGDCSFLREMASGIPQALNLETET